MREICLEGVFTGFFNAEENICGRREEVSRCVATFDASVYSRVTILWVSDAGPSSWLSAPRWSKPYLYEAMVEKI